MAEIQNVKIVNGVVVFPDYVPDDPNNKVYDVGAAQELIANLLGVGKRSDGQYHTPDICISSRINMMSRNKPIEHPSTGPLTDTERKGSSADQAAGIFYGIKVNGDTNLTIDTSLVNIHNITFEYKKPTGWKRLRDFNGYAHNAVPNPYADVPNVGYYNISQGISGIAALYRSGDKTGVDFTDMLVNESLTDTLQKAFPCILLTSGGKSYFTALYYSETGNPRPLLQNGQYATESWYCDLQKKLQSGVDEMNSPFNSAQTVTASIFLIKSTSASLPLLNLNANNFGTHWYEVKNGMVSTAAKPLVMPGALGKTIELKQYFAGLMFYPTSASAFKIVGNELSVMVKYAEMTGGTSANQITIVTTVKLTVTDRFGNRTTDTQNSSTTLNGWTGSSLLNQVSVGFGIVHQDGNIYEATVSMKTTDGSAVSTSNQYTFTL